MSLDNYMDGSSDNQNSKGTPGENHFENRTDDKRYRDEEWMRQKYIDEEKSLQEIADIVDSAYSTISRWANKHNIDTRGTQESKYESKDAIIDGLKRVSKEAGDDFTARDVESIECSALVNQCKQQFGSFNEAKSEMSDNVYKSDNERGNQEPETSKPEFGYLLGVLISDGWLTDSESESDQVSGTKMGVGVINKKFAVEFGKAFCKVGEFDKDELILRTRYEEKDREDMYCVEKRWKKLSNILKDEYALENWNEWVQELSNEQLIAYCRGVYDSEGTVMESGYRVSVKDGNHASSYLYALSQCLDIEPNRLSYRVNSANLPKEDEDGDIVPKEEDTTMCTIYVPSKYRSRFKKVIDPTIKRGPKEW